MIAVGHNLLYADAASVGSHCHFARCSQLPDPLEPSHHLESQAPGCRDLCRLRGWLYCRLAMEGGTRQLRIVLRRW